MASDIERPIILKLKLSEDYDNLLFTDYSVSEWRRLSRSAKKAVMLELIHEFIDIEELTVDDAGREVRFKDVERT